MYIARKIVASIVAMELRRTIQKAMGEIPSYETAIVVVLAEVRKGLESVSGVLKSEYGSLMLT
jgi:hypothetical protein